MNGIETIGWEKINGKWYYFNDAGYMVTGWIFYNEQWYYLKADGTMASDEVLTIHSNIYGEEKYMFGLDGHIMKVNNRGALY